jgi:hypothetical protein
VHTQTEHCEHQQCHNSLQYVRHFHFGLYLVYGV